MDIYELIAAKRGEILSLAERFGVKNIRIFGSVARHEAHDRSDIDILVEFPPARRCSRMQHSSANYLHCSGVKWMLHRLKVLRIRPAQRSCRKRYPYEIRS